MELLGTSEFTYLQFQLQPGGKVSRNFVEPNYNPLTTPPPTVIVPLALESFQGGPRSLENDSVATPSCCVALGVLYNLGQPQ